jgi:hypothetical protein
LLAEATRRKAQTPSIATSAIADFERIAGMGKMRDVEAMT